MLDIALKAIVTLMITAVLNKTLSVFRIRQLYVAVDQLLDCHDINVDGYIATLTIYNRGKDKEKSIKITIPETNFCQIIAQSMPGMTYEDNLICIDRLAPGETVTLSIFIKGRNKLSKKLLPIIKSEDITGRPFWGKENVWPSLGPAVRGISFLCSVAALLVYITWKAGGPDQAYYNLRYYTLHAQGFTPTISSDNHLISKLSIFESKYPFTVKPLFLKDGKLHFPVSITNTEKSPQKIKLGVAGIDHDYYRQTSKLLTFNEEDESKEKDLRARFSVPKEFWRSSEETLNPQETKTIVFTREITPNFKLQHVAFELGIQGATDSGEIYTDSYVYRAPSPEVVPKGLELTD